MYYCVIVAFCQHVLNEHAMLCYANSHINEQDNDNDDQSIAFYTRGIVEHAPYIGRVSRLCASIDQYMMCFLHRRAWLESNYT